MSGRKRAAPDPVTIHLSRTTLAVKEEKGTEGAFREQHAKQSSTGNVTILCKRRGCRTLPDPGRVRFGSKFRVAGRASHFSRVGLRMKGGDAPPPDGGFATTIPILAA